MRYVIILLALLIIAVGLAHADTWVPLTGVENLRELVSNKTVEIEIRPGVIAIGEYYEDGTAKIEAWDETFLRTWEVRGDNQVCYSSATETNCYTFEQNLSAPDEYRIRHVETGELTSFRVSGADLHMVTRETIPDDEGGMGAPSAQDIAAELANPNTTLGTMNFNFDYIAYDGDLRDADDQEALRLSFQPSLPYSLSDKTNLFFRPLIPLILKQDVPNSKGSFDSKSVELGDISFDASIGYTFSNGIILLGGLVGTLPTATDDALGLDQWLLGPEAVFAVVRKWGVAGILLTHQWDVAGEDDYSTSITGGQYFFTKNLTAGWQFISSPTFSYNHNADRDDAWTFPLAAGFSKTTIINGRPWKFGLQYWNYVKSPDTFGPKHQIRLTISPVVKLPW